MKSTRYTGNADGGCQLLFPRYIYCCSCIFTQEKIWLALRALAPDCHRVYTDSSNYWIMQVVLIVGDHVRRNS